jgi:hypothetical protein
MQVTWIRYCIQRSSGVHSRIYYSRVIVGFEYGKVTRKVAPCPGSLSTAIMVAIHNHMTCTNPPVYFLHYWGKGPAANLASGFKAALDQTGKGGSQASAGH